MVSSEAITPSGKNRYIMKKTPKDSTSIENLLFPKLDGKVSIGPYNLIELKTEAFKIYFNSNGVFDKYGEKITSNSVIKMMQSAQPERAKVI